MFTTLRKSEGLEKNKSREKEREYTKRRGTEKFECNRLREGTENREGLNALLQRMSCDPSSSGPDTMEKYRRGAHPYFIVP